MEVSKPYSPVHKIRIVTAASLFDGHDAAINIMRRIIQATGVEVIHLGHDRSVAEVVDCAIQEDANAIAMTSYQGGHNEYFRYMHDLLEERGAGHIRIFGGGGGVILPEEIRALMDYGIARIYSPDDGRELGLQGMINDLVHQSDYDVSQVALPKGKAIPDGLARRDPMVLARLISLAENQPEAFEALRKELPKPSGKTPVLGITGTGGAGKSSLVDELVRRFLAGHPDRSIGIVSVDPSKRKTGGALLGDRIRMNAIHHPNVYMRSLATRQSNLALSKYVKEAVEILKAAGFDLIILETSGIGQSDTEILEHSDRSLYVMTPEFGAATQLEKIDMLDFADLVAINKFDKRGALDALRDVKKQYRRNHGIWEGDDANLPVFGTIASQFNDPGMNRLYHAVMAALQEVGASWAEAPALSEEAQSEKRYIIPPARTRYLSEISESNRGYDTRAREQAALAERLYGYYQAACGLAGKADTTWIAYADTDGLRLEALLEGAPEGRKTAIKDLATVFEQERKDLNPRHWDFLLAWEGLRDRYRNAEYRFEVRGREVRVETHTESLSHLKVPKVALPRYRSWGDLLLWALQENVPGAFPYTAGLYPFKRKGEDPTRMFAGEGGPERTNRRFHYLSLDMPAKRLSTAFDSVTLYGNDPGHRPDIYGKIGNSGVSICCLDDAKKLYSGFDLADPRTSVSMTINGPAPMLLGYFLNAAIDQGCEKYIREHGLEQEVDARKAAYFKARGITPPAYRGDLPEGNNGLGLYLLGITGDQVLPEEVYRQIKAETLRQVRGTVQADILKEDQAQNTCIFSTEFALRLMGDVQEYFIENQVRNFYSVSISGYHIAEAGANPITQLAFTLANGFTYVEYYLSRGMDINAFGPNLSFFFSNGIDPEYAVIGRVARRIWAKALRSKYGADPRAQMLKYHIQTSGRSLHAQEIDFNDIRTTLQALYAIYDNCNSLHTNAYDEAITTPTEESVRRAMAIQLIINKELGLAKNENPLQGAFIIEELTDLVEEAVLSEFDRLTERGGVLGAMETMYQRSRIQEESLHYETLKHSGAYPIVGVNTFLNSKGSPTVLPEEVIRATEEEKQAQIDTLKRVHAQHGADAHEALTGLKQAAVTHENLFGKLMEVCKVASLGEITQALFEVGGQYRRNM
ncbi:methylmalonyl-CoA mutase family protein [Robiginitalea sediminis]|uniref:methylmalonyl-CoA mutase family protein n=1 Tax=Robiginitalea sediminis TaxID=1982593 RepID=UPI000B4AE62A|nr:methylmalonyl-CoA mutase family protein [Robiginitalea sediminis]